MLESGLESMAAEVNHASYMGRGIQRLPPSRRLHRRYTRTSPSFETIPYRYGYDDISTRGLEEKEGGEFLRSRDNRAEKARGRPSLDSVPLTRGVDNRSSPRIRSVIHRCDRKQVVGGVFVSIASRECRFSSRSRRWRGRGQVISGESSGFVFLNREERISLESEFFGTRLATRMEGEVF